MNNDHKVQQNVPLSKMRSTTSTVDAQWRGNVQSSPGVFPNSSKGPNRKRNYGIVIIGLLFLLGGGALVR